MVGFFNKFLGGLSTSRPAMASHTPAGAADSFTICRVLRVSPNVAIERRMQNEETGDGVSVFDAIHWI